MQEITFQFLIGKVQQSGEEDEMALITKRFQFLIGKVQRERAEYLPGFKKMYKFQFLIGKVQLS